MIHLIGDQVTFKQRSIQRCLWCGEKVFDTYWPDVEGTEDEKEHKAQNPVMGLVKVEGKQVSPYQDLLSEDEAPAGSCFFWAQERFRNSRQRKTLGQRFNRGLAKVFFLGRQA